jgi:hypothetical protein
MVALMASAVLDSACGGTGGAVAGGGGGSNHTAPASPVRLTVAVSGSGGGVVRESGRSFECWQAACAMDVPRGDHVHFTATPSTGARFVGWSGACAGLGDCDVEADMELSVVASFSML